MVEDEEALKTKSVKLKKLVKPTVEKTEAG